MREQIMRRGYIYTAISEFVRNYLLERQYPPSVEEIRADVGLSSASVVRARLREMRIFGMLSFPDGAYQSILHPDLVIVEKSKLIGLNSWVEKISENLFLFTDDDGGKMLFDLEAKWVADKDGFFALDDEEVWEIFSAMEVIVANQPEPYCAENFKDLDGSLDGQEDGNVAVQHDKAEK